MPLSLQGDSHCDSMAVEFRSTDLSSTIYAEVMMLAALEHGDLAQAGMAPHHF